MKIIYFDLCAVVIFLIILWTCITRKLTRGRTNRLYIAVSSLSLACTIADIIMEVTVNPAPLSARRVTFGLCITFLYFILRNVLLCVCFYMLLSITRTEYHLRSLKLQMAFWAPYAVLFVLLVRNFFTRDVFNVTAETGYTRESLMILFYIVALLYGVIGLTYCLFCRKYLPSKKWVSVFSVYVLNFIAVVVQFFWPHLLVEMFATAAGLLMILLQVMRPEENMDPTLEVRSWRAYQSELSNLMKTGPMRPSSETISATPAMTSWSIAGSTCSGTTPRRAFPQEEISTLSAREPCMSFLKIRRSSRKKSRR